MKESEGKNGIHRNSRIWDNGVEMRKMDFVASTSFYAFCVDCWASTSICVHPAHGAAKPIGAWQSTRSKNTRIDDKQKTHSHREYLVVLSNSFTLAAEVNFSWLACNKRPSSHFHFHFCTNVCHFHTQFIFSSSVCELVWHELSFCIVMLL